MADRDTRARSNEPLAFDYDLQCWARYGIIQRCGHPSSMACGCNGRTFAGMSLADARRVVTRTEPQS